MLREIHQVLDPYIREFDQRVENPRSFQAEQPGLPGLPNPFGNGSSSGQPPGPSWVPGGGWRSSNDAPSDASFGSNTPPKGGPIYAQPYRSPDRQADRTTRQY
jgi:hypothetical protein